MHWALLQNILVYNRFFVDHARLGDVDGVLFGHAGQFAVLLWGALSGIGAAWRGTAWHGVASNRGAA